MKSFLIECAKELNINITMECAEKLEVYKDLLIEWNKKMNLTAITNETDIVLKHFIDSITLFSAINVNDGDKVVDVGSGAGFPGLPMKIVKPVCDMTLMDSLNKRINFLKHVISCLSITGVSAVHMRAEEAGQSIEYREKFDICVSRAVSNMTSLAEYCLPLVKVGGVFAALKGPDANAELETAKNAINIFGGQLSFIKKVEIPKSGIIHTIIVIKKINQTPLKYPRKSVNIRKKPII